jgi:exopolysaccharide biosynthesis glucuronosyltransferase PssE
LIFLTVGTQLPFDRLVAEIDEWAGDNSQAQIFGQIGHALCKPNHFKHVDFLSPGKIEEYFQKADLIISHAGMGTVLNALKYQKALIIMPRRADLGEHRNDHQLATANWLNQKLGIDVAYEVETIRGLLEAPREPISNLIDEDAQPELIDSLKRFIFKIS